MRVRQSINRFAFYCLLLTLSTSLATSTQAQTRRINPRNLQRPQAQPAAQPRAADAQLQAPELPSTVAKAMGLLSDDGASTTLTQAVEPVAINTPTPAAPSAAVETNSPLTSIATGSGFNDGSAIASPTMTHEMHPQIISDDSMMMTPGGSCGPSCDGGCGASCGMAGGPVFGGNCGGYQGSGINFLPGMAIDHLSIFGGVQGFKNNSNRGADGSFGFHQGINFGTSGRNVIFPPSIGFQIGFQATQANFNGASFTLQERNQTFFTTGLFRRGDYGLQGGIVLDYMSDDWYYDLKVGQLRGELSMAVSDRTSYGFRFAAPLEEETVEGRIFGDDVVETWETADTYTIFIRSSLLAAGRGEGTLFAGLTGDKDGIVGAQSRLPLLNGFAIESEFTYLIPDETTGDGAIDEEAWNVGISIAWYPGSLACGSCNRYHRPMFDVANNGSFILRRR